MSEASTLFETATRAHATGDLARAERLYRAAIEADSVSQSARNNLMMLLRNERRWAEMEALIREWLAIAPQSAELRFRLADLLLAVPSRQTPRIQEVHVCLYHFICQEVEERLAAMAPAAKS